MAASIIAAIAAIAVACIEAYAQVQRSKSQRREEHAQRLAMAQYDVSAAQTEGLRLLLRRAHGEQLNGDVERAIELLDKAESEYTRVRTEIVARSA